MKKYLIIHGPNLNLLGEREPDIYGTMTLDQINHEILEFAKIHDIEVEIFQSNSEGEIIDKIHQARKTFDGIIINPAAYTHYSYAIHDALKAVNLPAVEVHLSDIKNREEFRKISVIKSACTAQFSGLGWKSYLKGLEYLLGG